MRRESGQASLELLAVLPLAAAIVLVAFQLLAAGASRELAANAAGAGAAALLQGGDPRAAARDALPGWSRSRVEVRVHGRRVRVRLRPVAVIPGAAHALTATAEADAGSDREDVARTTATSSLDRTERMRPGAAAASGRRTPNRAPSAVRAPRPPKRVASEARPPRPPKRVPSAAPPPRPPKRGPSAPEGGR